MMDGRKMGIVVVILQYLMNFGINIGAHFSSPEQIALYYNSLCGSYDCPPDISNKNITIFQLNPFAYPYFTEFPRNTRTEVKAERPTDDMEVFRQGEEGQVKLEIKMQYNYQENLQNTLKNKQDLPMLKKLDEDDEACPKAQKQRNLKKNTQSNLVNNVFSYICSQSKSHRVLQKLVGDRIEKLKIFYIFANNFKRINGKYLNRKNIKAICQIAPKLPHFKMLSKSIKRLMVLPMKELRVVLRKLIYSYLRGPESILPLLTSKKICKVAMLQHMTRRRDLAKLMTSMLIDYN